MGEAITAEFLNFARSLLPANPILCDIGSRDALEGIYLAQQLQASTLHVFEANPAAAQICRGHLQVLPEGSYQFNEVAVTDRVGELPFYPVNAAQSQNKDIGFSSLLRVNPEYTRRRGAIVQDQVTVRATTLDEYFFDKAVPHLLWIDVEGAELQVFQGGERVLQNVRLIHVEVSFRPMQIGKPLFWEIEKYLRAFGFALQGFTEVSTIRSFLYRHKLLPNLPWRLNAVFYKN